MNIKTNKIWKMLIVVLLITTSACGQQRGGQGGPPQGGGQGGGQQGPPAPPTEKQIQTMVDDLSKELLLNEEQEQIVLELYTAHFKTVEEKMSEGRPDREEMETLKKDLENDVNEVLNEDQQELYKTYLKNNSKKRKQKE
jgi:hypothetical protein